MLVAGVALAKDGRDFAGVYRVSDAVDQGDQMLVTLHVQLFNNSESDVKQAVLTLRHNFPTPGTVGLFRPVKLWRNHGEVRVTQQFVVPKREFESWSHGAQPALMVVYHDAEGQRFDRYVQVHSSPLIPN
jgi:hypothetical protein